MNNGYLTYGQLAVMGVSGATIRQWRSRGQVDTLEVGKTTYVKYSSIPQRTRNRFTPEEISKASSSYMLESQPDLLYNSICMGMKSASDHDFIRYRGIYMEQGCPLDKVAQYAKQHAVWSYLLNTYYSEKGQQHPVVEMRKAYNDLFPESPYSLATFRKKIAKALKDGIQSVVVKGKSTGRPRLYGDQYKYMVYQLASDAKRFSSREIHRRVCDICEEADLKSPSERTVNNLFREAMRNNIIYASRCGKDQMRDRIQLYASIKHAEYANDQWQIDGWTMPFYYRDPSDRRLKTLCLFIVMDAHSKKILGYTVSGSENTETILEGLEDAVRKTNELPFEIVSDNHSFNQTKIAENFKNNLDSLGIKWTVSSNPRHKQIIERSFRTFGEAYAKKHHGYTGQGIRSISPDAHISQELMDKYMKAGYLLTESQIKAIAVYCVDMWNKGTESEGKSPNQLYEESEKTNSIKLGNWATNPAFYDLFTRDMAEITVRNGQISITRAGHKYEYLLNSRQVVQYNNRTVTVKYIDLSEGVYMYAPSTGKPIGFASRKQQVHGALANRTEEDAAILGKISSINKAVIRISERKLLNLRESVDARLVELVNQRTTPKNVIQDMRENARYAAECARLGVDFLTTPDLPVFNEAYDTDRLLREKEEKTASSPFASNKREKVDLSFLDE